MSAQNFNRRTNVAMEHNLHIGETRIANLTHGCAIGETIKNKQKQTKNDTKNT